MPSSYTTRNRLNKQATGENSNLWGDLLNTGALDLIDIALDGLGTKALTADVSLTSANGTSDESRPRMLKFTGTGAFTVTIPSLQKWYIVWNACTGVLTMTTGAGDTAVLPVGAKTIVICDASNVYEFGYSGYGLKDYIDQAVIAATGSLPATTGNEDKVLQVQGGAWAPTDIGAPAATVRTGTALNRYLSPGDTYNALAEVTLTDASTIAVDMSTFINGVVTLGGNRTLGNPTNAKPGQTGRIRFIQDGTGTRTLTVSSNWKRSGGALALSTAPGTIDILRYDVISSTYIEYSISRNPS
jgi:hypothetical protein